MVDQITSTHLSDKLHIVLVGTSNGLLYIWDMNLREIRQRVKIHNGPLTSMALSHDHRYIATSGMEPSVSLYKLDTLESVSSYNGGLDLVRNVKFEHSSYDLVFGIDGKIVTLDAINQQITKMALIEGIAESFVQVAKDSDQILVGAYWGQIYLVSATGAIEHLYSLNQPMPTVKVSPNEKFCSACAGDAVFIDLETRESSLLSLGEYTVDTSFNVDSSELLVLTEKSITHWDVKTKKVSKIKHIDLNQPFGIEFSDGTYLVSTENEVLIYDDSTNHIAHLLNI